jgi:hypothetical protein
MKQQIIDSGTRYLRKPLSGGLDNFTEVIADSPASGGRNETFQATLFTPLAVASALADCRTLLIQSRRNYAEGASRYAVQEVVSL